MNAARSSSVRQNRVAIRERTWVLSTPGSPQCDAIASGEASM